MSEYNRTVTTVVKSEDPIDTFSRYVVGGIGALTSPSLQKEHLLSVWKETNRQNDEFTYYVDGRGLFQLTEEGEQIYLQDVTGRSTPIQQSEGKTVDELEMFAQYAEEGVTTWFSADNRINHGYPCSKFMFFKVSYDVSEKFKKPQKSLAVCTVMIDAPANVVGALLVKTLGREDIKNLEQLRGSLLNVDDQMFEKVVNLIASFNQNLLTRDKWISESDLIAKTIIIRDLINSGANPYIIARKAREEGILGKHSMSCDSAAVNNSNELEAKNHLTLEGVWCNNCGVCGAIINAYITAGYRCKNCEEIYLGVC